MSASKKLANSVKALIYLAEHFPEPKQSTDIAEEIESNASKIRQLLSRLVKAELVESIKGSQGGFRLKKQPEDIHLQDIYCTVEDQKVFPIDLKSCDPETKKIDAYFVNLYSDIQTEIEEKMKSITLKSIIQKIEDK